MGNNTGGEMEKKTKVEDRRCKRTASLKGGAETNTQDSVFGTKKAQFVF